MIKRSYRPIFTTCFASALALMTVSAVAQKDTGERPRKDDPAALQQSAPDRDAGKREGPEEGKQRRETGRSAADKAADQSGEQRNRGAQQHDGKQRATTEPAGKSRRDARDAKEAHKSRAETSKDGKQQAEGLTKKTRRDSRDTKEVDKPRAESSKDGKQQAEESTKKSEREARDTKNADTQRAKPSDNKRADSKERAEQPDKPASPPNVRLETKDQRTPERGKPDGSPADKGRTPPGRPAAAEATDKPDKPGDKSANKSGGRIGDRSSDKAENLLEVQKQRSVRKEGGGKREVITEPGNRTIIRENNTLVIRGDDQRRFGRAGKRNVERRDNRDIVIIERPNGVRIVSVYDDNGRLIERRRRHDGHDTLLIDNRRAYRGRGAVGLSVGNLVVELSAPTIEIPRRRYIVDYDAASSDEIYEALTAPPVEKLKRRYALDEIRYSHSLRERVRRVDLNAITFETGSWEIPSGQRGKLDRLAGGIKRALKRDPSEIFLIEGHTDAVGSDIDNLTLSDRRSESVAELLTSEYGIPPENLVTQGYGEKYLKVKSDGDEPANRRVAVRRITPLLHRS